MEHLHRTPGHQVESTLDVHCRIALKHWNANVLQKPCISQLSGQAALPNASTNATPNSSLVYVGSSE